MSRTGVCDFCGKVWNPMDHTWFCHHAEPFEVKDTDTGTTYEYDEQWLVCQICDMYIETKNKKGLALRAAETHPDRQPGNLRELYGIAGMLHDAFFARWQHSHPLYERRECLTRLPNVQ
jgi:esterase/lipase superfamily enzyme